MAAILLAGLLVVGLGEARAQTITADRPGLGDRAATVSGQTFQVELGYVFNSNGFRPEVGPGFAALSDNTHELGQLLVRYGVTDAVELRGGIGSYVFNESPVNDGYPGTSVGTKIRLFHSEVSTLTGMATLAIPTGTGPYDAVNDRARQQVKLNYNGQLGTGVSLGINAGTRFYYDACTQNDRAVEWLFIPTLKFGVTESTNAYVGYGGYYNEGLNANWVEGGLTFRTGANTQLDLNTGLRVDDNLPNDEEAFFIGVGLAHRF